MSESEEAYTLLDKLLKGEWNGGAPRSKESLISKAKKLRMSKGKKEQEKGKEKEKEKKKEEKKKKKEEKEKKKKLKEEVKDLEKDLALHKKRLRDLTLKIPIPSLFDQLGYDRVASLVTAGEVRSREEDPDLSDQAQGVLGQPHCQGKGQPWGQGGPKGCWVQTPPQARAGGCLALQAHHL